MMETLYRTGVGAYHLGLRAAARFGHARAGAWVAGRQRDVTEEIMALHAAGRPILWLHVASLGEYEQGLPVLTALREARPDWACVLTFFSPSGYARRHDTPHAEVVTYLPADGPQAARTWQQVLRPRLAIFVKYDFWHYHLAALRAAGVPTFLVAGHFRAGQVFFKPYGSWWRRMLEAFHHLFVQTPGDARLLNAYGITNVTVAGDPRVDRTAALADGPFEDTRLADFAAGHPVLFAGSVWPPDVKLLLAAWPRLRDRWRLVLAPHQLDEGELTDWQAAFGADRYTGPDTGSDVLLLDTVGILSRAYRYGCVAYVGGAFGSGLHNTLEPLSYGLPVLFGPKYGRFPEAGRGVAAGGAFCVTTPDAVVAVLDELSSPEGYHRSREAQEAYRAAHSGAGARTAAAILRLLCLVLLCLPVRAQSWSEAERMLTAVDGTFAKCDLMVAVSGVEWRSGLCLAAAEVERGSTISLSVTLEADRQYVFIGSGEATVGDMDLLLRDGAGKTIGEDLESDRTPVVEVDVKQSGTYSLQVHLLNADAPTAFVSVGILSSAGDPLSGEDYRQVSRQFGAAAGAVRAAGGAGRFGTGGGQWSVLGYLLEEGGGATLSNVRLPAGRTFIAATGGERVQNLDLYLAGADREIVRADDDPDAYPMIEYDSPLAAPYDVRLEMPRARGRALVLLGLFTR